MNKIFSTILLLLLLIVSLFAGFFTVQTPDVPTNYTFQLAYAGNLSLFPNLTLTPGDILTTNASIVCVTGYTATVRDVPDSLRKQVFARYGIDYSHSGEYECDHFISLELGGSNDIKNLFPEAYEPKPGAREKDQVENYLHKQVCSGSMTLEEAQSQIKTDWYKVYLQIHGN